MVKSWLFIKDIVKRNGNRFDITCEGWEAEGEGWNNSSKFQEPW